MGRIFCIMGKSNSGKDTIFKRLMKDKDIELIPVVTYTTRPKRSNETNGNEYYFIDKSILKKLSDQNKIIELRKYNTINGLWYYCTVDDGQISLENGNYILITTLEAYENICRYYGESNVIPIYIEVDDGERLERSLDRERHQLKPNYEEMCRRFLADSEDFSEQKLNELSITKRYINDDLTKCTDEIKKDILQSVIINNND